jgi:hypothetical protein
VLDLDSTDVLCYGGSDGSVTATWSGGTSPYTININGGAFVPATSPHTFNNLAAGSYEVVIKDAHNCVDTANITVTQPPELVLDLDSTDVLCYGGSDGSVTATWTGGTSPYMIRINGTGFVSATSPYVFSGLPAGDYPVVVKDSNDCVDSANITVTQPTELLCTVSPLDTLICVGDSAHFCVNPTGGTPPYSYLWDGPGGFTRTDSCIWAHDAGPYSVKVTDAQECTTRCEGTLTTEPCGDEFCSLTQGAYGNYGGNYFGMGTLQLIDSLLADSALVVGKPGRSITIPLAAAECIIARLPGGGTAARLPAIGDDVLGWNSCQTSPPLDTTKANPSDPYGRFKNVLLAQTITLSLNVRLVCDLGTFDICDSVETKEVWDPDGEPCTGDETAAPDSTPEGYFIPASVFTALTNLGLSHDVSGLLELANRALAYGTDSTSGASLSDVNKAVDAINELFDECRFVTYCGPRGPISLTSTAAKEAQSSASALPTEFSVSQSYPNPFNPECVIAYALPIDCQVKLSIYNILGQKVKVLVDEYQSAGYKSAKWDGKDDQGRDMASGIYFYRIEAGNFVQSKKMLLMK